MKTRAAIAVLVALLLASLAANVLAVRQGAHYYRQINALALDPLGLGAYPPGAGLAGAADASPRLAVFLGDSRAVDWPPPETAGWLFVNRGIYGQTSAQVLGRFDAHVAPLGADVIVVQAGINDLKTIPLFPEQRAAIVQRCRENIQSLVARSAGLGATVIVTTVFPPGPVPPQRRLFWSDDVGLAVAEVNTFIEALAGDHVIVLDAARVLAGNNGETRPEFSRDLLHLSPAGYEALNRALLPVLAGLEQGSTH